MILDAKQLLKIKNNSKKIGSRSTYLNASSILLIKVKRQLKKDRLKKRKLISERRREKLKKKLKPKRKERNVKVKAILKREAYFLKKNRTKAMIKKLLKTEMTFQKENKKELMTLIFSLWEKFMKI